MVLSSIVKHSSSVCQAGQNQFLEQVWYNTFTEKSSVYDSVLQVTAYKYVKKLTAHWEVWEGSISEASCVLTSQAYIDVDWLHSKANQWHIFSHIYYGSLPSTISNDLEQLVITSINDNETWLLDLQGISHSLLFREHLTLVLQESLLGVTCSRALTLLTLWHCLLFYFTIDLFYVPSICFLYPPSCFSS